MAINETPIHGLQTPDDTEDIASYPSQLATLAGQIDTKLIAWMDGTLAARPEISPTNPGNGRQAYRAIDTGQVFVDAVDHWEQIGAGAVQYAEDLTQRTVNAGGGVVQPDTVGVPVSVTVTVGDSGLCSVMCSFESRGANSTSNGWVQLTRDGTVIGSSWAGAGDSFPGWLFEGTGFHSGGTVTPSLPITNSSNHSPILTYPIVDTPGAGQHTYELLFGATGTGGDVRNRKLWGWASP